MLRLEVLVSDPVLVFLLSLDPLPLIVPTSTSPPLVLIVFPKSIREVLSVAPPIGLNTAFEPIAPVSHVTIDVTFVLVVRLTSALHPIATRVLSPAMTNSTSTLTLTSMEISRVLRTTLG